MTDIAWRWLDEQRTLGREFLLVIDRLAEPDPIPMLFQADVMRDYVNLYQGTAVNDLADIGPWLVRLTDAGTILPQLLKEPEQHWGWIASAKAIDLAAVTAHWRARMLIRDNGTQALYRFQDSRVIAHHLRTLQPEELPLLLGPLDSVLCWDKEHWQRTDNPHPARCPSPFDTPWLDIPEPEPVADAIRMHNQQLWLWDNHPSATARLLETEDLPDWLQQQFATAKLLGWHTTEQIQFLLQYQLDPRAREHPAWLARSGETADEHFRRCHHEITSATQRHS
ncbi:MAG TPA: DUF4123 domain-containing protein [Pseudomonas xinjiangensis]|uniref:DUF4123 domain-containing protein n=2 Tax=root TaxID=1 RepID=A0A7V1BS59_9GAMM|nr:DUF4123 domain-containing protein [Halopseudomonas xinjiangensis]HEC48926.1 DUF4123 domain-containing protein [Halopseudomonas xinjiangensis]